MLPNPVIDRADRHLGATMTDEEKKKADLLLSRIETATGSFPERSGPNSALITEIIHAVNGLRSLLGLVRTH
jgi:hypothetical protein